MNRDLELHGLVGGKPNVKKVLKGSVTTTEIGNKTTITVNLNESVNKDKSIILIQNPRKYPDVAQSVTIWFIGEFTSNSSISLTRASSEDLSPTSRFPQFVPLHYTVIEFDNVKSLQKGTVYINSPGKEVHKMLAVSVNTRKSLLFYNMHTLSAEFSQGVPFYHINLRRDASYSYIDFFSMGYGVGAQYWVVEFF